MTIEWLTGLEMAERTGVHESSFRRYARQFPEHIPSRQFGKAKKFDAACVPVVRRISEMYRTGMGTEEVKATLAENLPQVFDVSAEDDIIENIATPAAVVIASELEKQNSLLERIAQAMEDQAAATAEANEARAIETQALLQEVARLRADLAEQDRQARGREWRIVEELEEIRMQVRKKPWWKFW